MNIETHQRPTTLLFVLAILSTITFKSFSQEKFGGLALYTVRDNMAANPKATLEQVASAGYKYIEAAGYSDGKFYNMFPEAFKNMLNEIGLTPISSHNGGVNLENADKIIADVKRAGFKYFVLPVPPKINGKGINDDIKLITGALNTIGKKCKEAGLQLLYHNHDFEFKETPQGIIPIDYFLENTDPEFVNFQMDLFWVTKAGAKPIDYFKKYPGRFKIWHVKDMDADGKFAPVGKGTINFAEILKNKELSGMEYYMVEQDQTFGEHPMVVIKISHDGLIKLGFQ